MKMYKLSTFLVALFLFGFGATAIAQYDDVYFDPSNDTEEATYETSYDDYDEDDSNDNDFDAASYDDDDYDYYYTSRIRRFQRPYSGFGFYSPAYVDSYYYGGYGTPGRAIYASNFNNGFYNPYNSFGNNGITVIIGNRNRYRGFNPYRNQFNPYNPYAFNNGFGSRSVYGGGFNRVAGNSFGGGYACPPSWNGSGSTFNRTTRVVNNSTRVRTPRTSGNNRTRTQTKSQRSSVGRSSRGTTTRGSSRATTRSTTRSSSTRSNTRATKKRSSIFNKSRSNTSRSNTKSRTQRRSSSRSSATPSRSSSRSSSGSSRSSRSSSSRRGN